MKINFTKEQYETLIKIVYMGNGIVNAVDESSEDNEFTAMEEYIFSFAKNVGLEHLVDHDETENKYYPSEKLEEDEEIIEYIQSYDDNIFWEKLIFNLTRRDMENKYGIETVEKMSDEEGFAKGQPIAEKYEKEFSKNGLTNLKI